MLSVCWVHDDNNLQRLTIRWNSKCTMCFSKWTFPHKNDSGFNIELMDDCSLFYLVQCRVKYLRDALLSPNPIKDVVVCNNGERDASG